MIHGYDQVSDSERCNQVDLNNNGYLDFDEGFFWFPMFNPIVDATSTSDRQQQQTCSHCSWYDSQQAANVPSSLPATTIAPSSEDEMQTQPPYESNATCLTTWVDEKNTLYSEYYICDTACDDSIDCSDCDSKSMCSLLGLFFTDGDFSNDGMLVIYECGIIMSYISTTALSGGNGYDTVWWSMSNSGRCQELDTNNDGAINSEEIIQISKHFMRFDENSEETEQWEFENRYLQVSCDHCDWYDTYK